MTHRSPVEAPGADRRDIGDALLLRRSIRRFEARPLSRQDILNLIDLARWAPSPHNSQPWRFTVLSFEARRRLAVAMATKLQVDLQRAGVDQQQIERQTGRSHERITSAPAAVLLSLVTDGLVLVGQEREDGLEFQMAVQSTGAALENLFVAAAGKGIGTCWMAAPMYCAQEVVEALDLPRDYRPQALILLGYPASEPNPRPRLPLDKVVTFR